MFDTVLIANRGEIACRIAATCRRLGIGTVAVYSDADADARHVAACDTAWRLGPAPARDSYLRGDLILEIAAASGARAIHPGYGFLAENAGFAAACEAAGVIFVGPPAAAIRAMGLKHTAKALMADAGVPVVPGYHGDDQDLATLADAAARVGYPVLIKPVAGGGGKGMRVAESAAELEEAVAAARREAAAGFGDDRLLLEKYLPQLRHIEVQVFADRHGQIVHLFERDCSLQRRHQKVLEEAPAPSLSDGQRRRMGAAAVAAARAIGYRGAGTVEFIATREVFYFMEMNTRLQVEHPVTEAITGQDLVEWQLRVAAGEPLPCGQEALAIHGHAIEARLYAEDPAQDFRPASGRLLHLHLPEQRPQVRVDSGVGQGDVITPHYDPLLAKLIVWDRDRDAALRRLRRALAECRIVGVATNREFLAALAAHPAVAAGEMDTDFIARHRAGLLPTPVPDRALALAALGELLHRQQEATAAARRSADPWSPWQRADGWRLNGDHRQVLHFRHGGEMFCVTALHRPDHCLLELPGGSMTARGELEGIELRADLAGLRLRAVLVRHGEEITVFCEGREYALTLHDPLAAGREAETPIGSLAAPLPGIVAAVLVRAGDAVDKGAPLVILEAMKMEQTIRAPYAGRVGTVHVAAGDTVEEGVELLTILEG